MTKEIEDPVDEKDHTIHLRIDPKTWKDIVDICEYRRIGRKANLVKMYIKEGIKRDQDSQLTMIIQSMIGKLRNSPLDQDIVEAIIQKSVGSVIGESTSLDEG